jgi:type I restriction enzyme, S subunit
VGRPPPGEGQALKGRKNHEPIAAIVKTRTVQLGEVCEFLDHRRKPVSEELRKPGPYPYYGANGLQGWIDDYIFNETLVLLAEDGGHFGSKISPIAYRISGKTCVNNHAHVLRPLAGCDPDYLTHVLSFYDVTKLVSGTTRPKLTKGNAELIQIPLPSLSDQQRIAGQLEQTDRLRRTRRYALELTDTFLPAAFLQLFGDLRDNRRKWHFAELEANSEIVSGVAKGQKYRDRQTTAVPYLRVANVQDGHLDLAEIKTIRVPPEEVEALRLKPGDVVMTEGGDFDKLGRGAIWPGGIQDCIHQNHIFRVRLDQSVLLPAFFAAFLRSPFAKDYFLRCSKQTTNLASINMTQLRATPVPLPPLVHQQQFAALVARVERLRWVQRESLRQSEHLFKSLLRRAFGGDVQPSHDNPTTPPL